MNREFNRSHESLSLCGSLAQNAVIGSPAHDLEAEIFETMKNVISPTYTVASIRQAGVWEMRDSVESGRLAVPKERLVHIPRAEKASEGLVN